MNTTAFHNSIHKTYFCCRKGKSRNNGKRTDDQGEKELKNGMRMLDKPHIIDIPVRSVFCRNFKFNYIEKYQFRITNNHELSFFSSTSFQWIRPSSNKTRKSEYRNRTKDRER